MQSYCFIYRQFGENLEDLVRKLFPLIFPGRDCMGKSWFLGQGELKELPDEWFEHHFPVMMFRNRMMRALSVFYSVGVVESGFISSTSVFEVASG